ncbi:hypothetical protein IPJ72_05845 [Candidatus Peregrinibacteria bacterium]|nr:MAG: hypothetical protein IPJ72_05845 [Candidatus Peregrinibacteria bacterium]
MKTCQKCPSSFELLPQGNFIRKELGIPEPTLCPQCRNIRRMTWRNDRTFYHAKSALSGKPMISMYPTDTPYTVYLQSEWYDQNKWNPFDYGRDFDFSRPFFEQFHELQLAVPRMNLDIVNCENSDYCNYCGDDKNCYLDIAGESNEDCYYNLFVKYSKNVVDCTFIYNSERCYESINCYHCYNVYYAQYCQNTSDSAFVYDLIGCKNCLFSNGLRNKEYYIFNEPHTKEEFEKKKSELLNGSYKILKHAIELWKKRLIERGVFRNSYQVNCENSSGNNLKNCKNVQFGFNVTDAEDSQFLYDVLDAKNCSDLNYSLYKPELSYELISTLNMTHSAFNMASHFCHDVFYSDQCNHSKHLFGCAGLTRQEYCILNKKYSKEDYYNLKSKILNHMKATGEWGEFFPSQFSPFGYNETVAHEYHPLTKANATERGFKWMDDLEIKNYKGPAQTLPDNIADVTSEKIKEVIVCEGSQKPFRVIEQELRFYKEMNLPLPRRSPQQRHLDRMKLRTARSLCNRNCQSCHAQIQTTYTPDRPEKVVCEHCYLKNIY